MLEKAIEIEGLLRIIREGNPLPETYKLLTAKTESLASEATALADATTQNEHKAVSSVDEKPTADFVMAAPEATPKPPKVDFTAPETPRKQSLIIQTDTIIEPQGAIADLTEIDLDLEEEDDIILSFDDITEPIPATEEIISVDTIKESAPASEDIISYNLLEEPTEMPTDEKPTEERTMEEIASKGDTFPEEENNASEEESATQDTQKSKSTEEKAGSKRQVKLRSVFSLNDRFLYARELFNGNMKMFDSTIDHLEGIDDFSIVEDYFYNEMDWNPEDNNVASFMERLRGVF